MKQFKRHLLGIIISFAAGLVLMGTLSPKSYASEKEEKVVRVGWYNSLFNTTDSMGRKSGYGYEYQQKIASYTGWTYEYVEGGWVELLDMLQRGEIDILSDVSYTEERVENILFSNYSMGTEEYYVLARGDNTEINPGDISTLNGKRVGINIGTIQEKMYIEWAKENGIDTEIVGLEGNEDENIILLNNGDIDAIVYLSGYDMYMDSCVQIVLVGASDFYFGISNDRPDLKEDIDHAMSHILNQNQYYNKELADKYMSSTGTYFYLSNGELKWIEKHGTIKIGYRDNYLPFCSQDEAGEHIGILPEFMEMANNRIKNVDIAYELLPYSSTTEALQALMRGEIDCVFPMCLSAYDAETYGVSITESLTETEEFALVRKTDVNSFDSSGNVKVAINEGNPNYISVVWDSFPNWEMVFFKNTEECLRGIADGRADCILVSNYRINALVDQIDRYKLAPISVGSSMSLSFASKKGEAELFSILGKLVYSVTYTEVQSMLIKNSIVDKKVSFYDFISDNLIFAIPCLGILVAVITFLLVKSKSSEKKAKELYVDLKSNQEQLEHLTLEQEEQIEKITILNRDLEEARIAAEEASRAKSAFLSKMSHDIRTPLNGIIGLMEINEKHSDDYELVNANRAKAKIAANHLLGLINDVLDLSKLENDDTELPIEAFNLSNLCADVITICSIRAKENGITLEYANGAGVEYPNVYGSPLQLKQILLNLMNNAVKYNNPGGAIYEETRVLSCDGDMVVYEFTVKDTGIGMSKEYVEHIYEPFTQEKNDARSRYQGTGIGMSIVKTLVDKMNGTILCESEPGEGTTFRVAIPFRICREAVEDDYINTTGTTIEGLRVLLVEDNELNMEIATTILEDAKAIVTPAVNGREAVDIFRDKRVGTFDVILMDIMMPELDGYGAAKAIRKLDKSDALSIPIIAMSANAFAEDILKAKEAGMNDHLSKPIQTDLLIRTLSRFL